MKYITSTIVRNVDISLNGNLFGGTLLRWLDEYGALFVYKYLHHTFVTYKMGDTYFLKSAKLGELIDFYMDNLKFNKLSVSFDLVAKTNATSKEIINTNMTFVAIDINTEKAIQLNPFLFEKSEFKSFVQQKVKTHLCCDQEMPVIENVGKKDDLSEFKKHYIAQLYKAIYIEEAATAISVFQKDYGKLLEPKLITEVIAIINS